MKPMIEPSCLNRFGSFIILYNHSNFNFCQIFGALFILPPKTSKEIIEGAKLDWKVNAAPMKTDLHGDIANYHAIYREDNQEVLGVANRAYPKLVQNAETFTTFDQLIGESLDVETAASLGRGETVFGCFKIRNSYKVMDDETEHYFVVMS